MSTKRDPALPESTLGPDARILITGGTGFFGRALLRHWLAGEIAGDAPPRVLLLSREPERFLAAYPELAQRPWVQCWRGDILSPESLPPEDDFSHVLHAAADSTLGPSLPALLRHDQIVQGTRNLLDWALARSVPRFLLTSSGGAYGPQPENMPFLEEDYTGMPDPMRAANVYGVAKRAAEHLCALYQDRWGLEVVVARCFAFVGEDLPLDVHFAIGNFVRDALAGGHIEVAGDGSAVRSYLDQRDLAHWLITLLVQGRAGRAYNVGSDQALTIAELAHRVRDLLAPGKSVNIRARAPAAGAKSRYVPSIRRAAEELGLGVTVELDQAIRDMGARLRAKAARASG